ncbi:Lrp/AsnC family transcriptional regulator [Zunongwangia sp.]|uniref:Lrp/AsnC family transcriptional regulator n=1 Tax=Zunongwangia sp. TaxID=1965325 RepID=UPI003AA9A52C
MDKLSKNIIKVLQDNSRSTYAEIGRKVGLSAPAVAERIQKLEDSGIIDGYSLKLNKKNLGLHVEAIIYLDVLFLNFKKLIDDLSDIPEIQECLKVTGKHSIILKVAVEDNEALERVIDKVSLYGQPQTSLILSSYTNP